MKRQQSYSVKISQFSQLDFTKQEQKDFDRKIKQKQSQILDINREMDVYNTSTIQSIDQKIQENQKNQIQSTRLIFMKNQSQLQDPQYKKRKNSLPRDFNYYKIIQPDIETFNFHKDSSEIYQIQMSQSINIQQINNDSPQKKQNQSNSNHKNQQNTSSQINSNNQVNNSQFQYSNNGSNNNQEQNNQTNYNSSNQNNNDNQNKNNNHYLKLQSKNKQNGGTPTSNIGNKSFHSNINKTPQNLRLQKESSTIYTNNQNQNQNLLEDQLKKKQQIQEFFQKKHQIIGTGIRRKSCYCSECGKLSKFQKNLINLDIDIRSPHKYMHVLTFLKEYVRPRLFQKQKSKENNSTDNKLSVQKNHLTLSRKPSVQQSQNRQKNLFQNQDQMDQTKGNKNKNNTSMNNNSNSNGQDNCKYEKNIIDIIYQKIEERESNEQQKNIPVQPKRNDKRKKTMQNQLFPRNSTNSYNQKSALVQNQHKPMIDASLLQLTKNKSFRCIQQNSPMNSTPSSDRLTIIRQQGKKSSLIDVPQMKSLFSEQQVKQQRSESMVIQVQPHKSENSDSNISPIKISQLQNLQESSIKDTDKEEIVQSPQNTITNLKLDFNDDETKDTKQGDSTKNSNQQNLMSSSKQQRKMLIQEQRVITADDFLKAKFESPKKSNTPQQQQIEWNNLKKLQTKLDSIQENNYSLGELVTPNQNNSRSSTNKFNFQKSNKVNNQSQQKSQELNNKSQELNQLLTPSKNDNSKFPTLNSKILNNLKSYKQNFIKQKKIDRKNNYSQESLLKTLLTGEDQHVFVQHPKNQYFKVQSHRKQKVLFKSIFEEPPINNTESVVQQAYQLSKSVVNIQKTFNLNIQNQKQFKPNTSTSLSRESSLQPNKNNSIYSSNTKTATHRQLHSQSSYTNLQQSPQKQQQIQQQSQFQKQQSNLKNKKQMQLKKLIQNQKQQINYPKQQNNNIQQHKSTNDLNYKTNNLLLNNIKPLKKNISLNDVSSVKNIYNQNQQITPNNRNQKKNNQTQIQYQDLDSSKDMYYTEKPIQNYNKNILIKKGRSNKQIFNKSLNQFN